MSSLLLRNLKAEDMFILMPAETSWYRIQEGSVILEGRPKCIPAVELTAVRRIDCGLVDINSTLALTSSTHIDRPEYSSYR